MRSPGAGLALGCLVLIAGCVEMPSAYRESAFIGYTEKQSECIALPPPARLGVMAPGGLGERRPI